MRVQDIRFCTGCGIPALQAAAAADVIDHDGVLADTLVLLMEQASKGPGG